MNKTEDIKRKRINDIVSVVKLSSLLFAGIGFFKRFLYENKAINDVGSMFALYAITMMSFVLFLIYGIWSFSTIRSPKSKYYELVKWVEDVFFIVVFLIVVVSTGAETSDYKFLFLFIIITSTIQSGMRYGIIIAMVSSVTILAMDIICMPNVLVNQYFENDIIMAGMFLLTAWPLGFYVKIENDHIKKLKNLANEDGLTGVYNHRYFYEALKMKIESCERSNKPVSMIFMDIDYFKYYNDLYGHQKGDDVLRIIAAILKDSVRKEDIVARYGGEEFSIIMPDTDEEEAFKMAETIRKRIENKYFDGEENQPNGKITVSVGISVFPYKAKNDIELIKSADDALYKAKFFNKNRVETYTSILDELKNDIEEEHIDLVTSIKTLISVINAKDKYTYGHVERVVFYCRLLAEKLQLDEEQKKELIYGAYMHDTGKINISKEILNKKMPLTNEEWEILKSHPANGVEIIKPVEALKNIAPLILHHHERYDGKGYPQNLKGEEIPYLARILTVADSFDAMTSNRPYTRRKTYEEAVEELERCSGTQFDPTIARSFIELIKEKGNMFGDK